MRGERQPAPKFHPKKGLPNVPEGMELIKFYKEPVLVPKGSGRGVIVELARKRFEDMQARETRRTPFGVYYSE